MSEKKYAIITYTKVHHLITEDQHNTLLIQGNNAKMEINGSIVKMANIADILPIDKYYEAYPYKRIVKDVESPPFPKVNRQVFNSNKFCNDSIIVWKRMVKEREAKGETCYGLYGLIEKAEERLKINNSNTKLEKSKNNK